MLCYTVLLWVLLDCSCFVHWWCDDLQADELSFEEGDTLYIVEKVGQAVMLLSVWTTL